MTQFSQELSLHGSRCDSAIVALYTYILNDIKKNEE